MNENEEITEQDSGIHIPTPLEDLRALTYELRQGIYLTGNVCDRLDAIAEKFEEEGWVANG